MHNILVDGVQYAPMGVSRSSIGVGITTRNRPEVFKKCYEEITRRTPGAKIVVVDDASSKPIDNADHRFEDNAGIAVAKNKCLELLDDCEHIFLFDDDCYPIVDDWYQPYIDSPEPHLMYIFPDLAGPRKLNDIKVLYRDSQHVAYSGSRGCMIYVHRDVLRVVGGMDPVFGKWGWEHPSWSGRINNAGLSTWRYADVSDSEGLFYSADEHVAVQPVNPQDRTAELRDRNVTLYRKYFRSSHYVEYRETKDVVISTLFTSQNDPQRGKPMKCDPSMYKALANSLGTHKLVLLNDQLSAESTDQVELVKVEAPMNPYFQRWISIWQYLRDHPDIDRVWCVDATDVEMLRNPFPEMDSGRLYVGSEASVVGSKWMVTNHKAKGIQEFLTQYKSHQLLNAGLVGGSRKMVMEFLGSMIRVFFHNRQDHLYDTDNDLGVGDMALFNMVAWTQYYDVIDYGTRVNTVFKAEERNEWSWWKHK